ncbi:serine/threonine-protein kinase [Candidatus Uabimicrobium amorphum]|uniref:Protein kinase n=1 Tax=Uabimicrobium amorphum TaxID=2596890 RepID=A0A5S9IKV9_UABAM|nr:serine/threonine-protein kinase [Candidatus Uabimicrobium amorphum]BBM83574.1 protein kinase [Candidatus Uabimicrobium amorphum]
MDVNESPAPNMEKRNRLFVRLLMNEKFITEEMLSECLVDVDTQRDFVADVFVHKNYLTHEMVAGIYLKSGVLHCPYCHSESRMEKPVVRAQCSSCEKFYTFPLRYPFFKRKNSTTASMQKLTGCDLHQYRIQYCLGSGGMGEVYRALQKGLNRPVAIKILAPHLANNPKLVQRFQREAKLAAQLNHPNLVQIHDVGTFEEYHYIVMEYVDGIPLQQKVPKNTGIPLQTVIHYLRESVKGLKSLHDKEIIHRDIKPDNIMIGNDGQVKLTDFGLAKSEEGGSDYLTKCGAIIGTPNYMSPEQCIGKAATKMSDIYSLGITFYYMLKGQVPYSGNTTLEIITQHINNPSPDLQKDLSPKLNKIYQKMVAENPEKRYVSVEELNNDLMGLTEKDYIVREKSKKKRYIVIAIVVLVLLSLVGKKRRQRHQNKNKMSQKKEAPQHKKVKHNKTTPKKNVPKFMLPKNQQKVDKKRNNNDLKILKRTKREVTNGNMPVNKAFEILQQLIQGPQTRPDVKLKAKKLVDELQDRIEKRRALEDKVNAYIQEVTKKRWSLLLVDNPNPENFKPQNQIRILVQNDRRWPSLQKSVREIIHIRATEKNNIHLAKEKAVNLYKTAKSKELAHYIDKLNAEIRLLKIWGAHFAELQEYTQEKYYKEAYLYLKNLESEIDSYSQAKSYQNIRKMYVIEKKIIKNVWDLWSIFENNIYDYLEAGQQIKIKDVAADKIVRHIVKNKKKYKYKVDIVQICFFYLFEKNFTLAEKMLRKAAKKNDVIEKLYNKHLHYLQR